MLTFVITYVKSTISIPMQSETARPKFKSKQMNSYKKRWTRLRGQNCLRAHRQVPLAVPQVQVLKILTRLDQDRPTRPLLSAQLVKYHNRKARLPYTAKIALC